MASEILPHTHTSTATDHFSHNAGTNFLSINPENQGGKEQWHVAEMD
jgi:hypothetical protein